MWISLLSKSQRKNVFFNPASLLGAFPTRPCWTAMDCQWRCIFIIWLNCAWCAIRMEISPARDDKYFMRRNLRGAGFDLQTASWLYFFSPATSWLSPSDEAVRQTPSAPSPPAREAQGESLSVTPTASDQMTLAVWHNSPRSVISSSLHLCRLMKWK